jgi:hypothetical protein
MSSHSFEYLIEKVRSARWRHKPFKHCIISNFFKAEDFNKILEDPRCSLEPAESDRELVKMLKTRQYMPSWLPGSTDDVESYLSLREGAECQLSRNNTCEKTGVAFRLKKDETLNNALDRALLTLDSQAFWSAIYEKAALSTDQNFTTYVAYTKYLDGHEISPHTDSRHKPVTFLINVNPLNLQLPVSSFTALMSIRDEYRYIPEYWKYNQQVDRCWLPWGWANPVSYHSANNSILIIPASDYSFHSIRLHYDHLAAQRSLIYGTSWISDQIVYECPTWEDLQIIPTQQRLINYQMCTQWLKSPT